MSRLDDLEALIERVGQGDRKAFGALYSATSAKVFGLLIRILGNRSDAEDVLQETYVRVWKTAGRYAGADLGPMTWLLTIARNAGIEKVRASREANPNAALPEPATSGASDLVGGEVQAIEAGLAELDDDRAAAIRGAYLDGLTYEQLAARYEVPMNTMRTWLRRSLMNLRESMAR